MADWYLAPSLAACRAEADRLYPNRSKASDGTLGDSAHSSRTSDHNPKPDGHGGLVVDALDLTHDPAHGFDAHAWIRVRCAASDPRIKYAISNGFIWTPGSGWVRYTGSNPHDRHVHISVKASTPARADTSPWFAAPPQEDDDMLTPDQAADLTAVKNYVVDAQPRLVDLQTRLTAVEGKTRDSVNYDVDAQARLAALEEVVRAIAAKVGA